MAEEDDKPTVYDRPASAERPKKASVSPRYESKDEIARGGMGRVVEARDTLLGRTVAVKEALSLDAETLRRFARETRITARLEHPSIVPVYDAGTTPDGSPYYVMRKISGRPLDDLVDEAKTLDQRLALLPNVLAATQAMAHAHDRGVLHRDLKPANILVGDFGETVVIDWGLAKVIDEPDEPDDPKPLTMTMDGDSLRTRVGVVFGTPGFMSPEQVRGAAIDARSDVYALGATLYYVLARRAPHHAAKSDDMFAAAAKGPPSPIAQISEGIPRELSTIIDKALAYDHAARYRDAGELAEDLQRFLTGQLVASHRYSRRERITRFLRKNRIAVVAVALAMIVLVVGGTFAVRRVIVERDRADSQARLATEGRRNAEAAEHRETERADQLLLAQAEMLVATNPTAAVAVLKEIAKRPERWKAQWRHARAIAADARVAGVAYGVPGPPFPISIEMSPDGTHALVTDNRDGYWYVDLAARTARNLGDLAGTLHFAGPNHFIRDSTDRIDLIEIATLKIREFRSSDPRDPRVSIHNLEASEKRAVYIAIDDGTMDVRGKFFAVFVIDLVTGARSRYQNLAATRLHLAPDGNRVLMDSASGVQLADIRTTPAPMNKIAPTGYLLAAWNASSTAFALVYPDRVGWFELGKPPVWVELPGRPVYVIALENTPVVVGAFSGVAMIRNKKLVMRAGRVTMTTFAPQPVSRDRFVLANLQDMLLVDGESEFELHSPLQSNPRFAGSPNSSFLVLGAPGRILVWDLEQIKPTPKRVATNVSEPMLLSAREFLVTHAKDLDKRWIDLAANVETPLVSVPLTRLEANQRRDRLLLLDIEGRATLFGDHGRERTVLGTGVDLMGFGSAEEAWIENVKGEIEAFGVDGKSLFKHRAPHRLDAVGWNQEWIGGLLRSSKLWRWNRKTNREETFDLQLKSREKQVQMVVVGPDGRVLVPIENRIESWEPDGKFVTHVTLPDTVTWMSAVGSSLIAVTVTGAGFRIKDGKVSPTIPMGARAIDIAPGVDLATFEYTSGGVHVVDLEVGRNWRLTTQPALRAPTIAADGTAVLGTVGTAAFLWPLTLPADAEATRRWLDELTNATADMGPTTLSWR